MPPKAVSKKSRKPAKKSRKPMKKSRKPTKKSRKPVKKSRKPKKTSRKPKKTSRKPKKTSRKPKKTSRKPKKASRKPKKASRKPKKASRKPKKASRKPKKASRKPKKVSRKPKKVSRKPKKASRKPKKASRKPKKTSRKPKKASRKPKKTSRKPTIKVKSRKYRVAYKTEKMDGTYLPLFFYINHHDRLTHQENNNLMNYYFYGRNALPKEFVLTKAIGVDTRNTEANELRKIYNNQIAEQGIRQSWGDEPDENLNNIRKELIKMAQDSENNAVNFIQIIEPINPYGTNWRDYLPDWVRKKYLSNNTDDPRLLAEQAHVTGIKALAYKKAPEDLLHTYGHKPLRPTTSDHKPPPPTKTGGYHFYQ